MQNITLGTYKMQLGDGCNEPYEFGWQVENALRQLKRLLDRTPTSQAEDYFAECFKKYSWSDIRLVARCGNYEGEIYSIQQRLTRIYHDDYRTNYGKCWLR